MACYLRSGALAIVTFVMACGGSPDVSTPAENPVENVEPSVLIERPMADQVEPSIFRIVAFGCGAPALGTGFAVTADLVVTSGHIITGRDTDTMRVQRLDGTEHKVALVAFDQDLDLALLRVDGVDLQPLNLVTDVPLADGVAIGIRSEEEVNILNEVDFTVDAPVIVNWDGVFRDTESSYRGIRIHAEIRKGDSGSPLLINSRDVIGLVQSKNRGLPRGYAVRSEEILELVDTIDPAVEVVADRCA